MHCFIIDGGQAMHAPTYGNTTEQDLGDHSAALILFTSGVSLYRLRHYHEISGRILLISHGPFRVLPASPCSIGHPGSVPCSWLGLLASTRSWFGERSTILKKRNKEGSSGVGIWFIQTRARLGRCMFMFMFHVPWLRGDGSLPVVFGV